MIYKFTKIVVGAIASRTLLKTLWASKTPNPLFRRPYLQA